MKQSDPKIGVIIVTYNADRFIIQCLTSLLSDTTQNIRVVVCDNNSSDATVDVIRDWVAGDHKPEAPADPSIPVRNPKSLPVTFSERRHADPDPATDEPAATVSLVTLVHTGANRGYAGAVNIGLETLAQDDEIEAFWILNPDCIVPAQTVEAFAQAVRDTPSFGLMGGRILYADTTLGIHSDGGRVNRWTGVCSSINIGADPKHTPMPAGVDIDYISGASLLVSRDFYYSIGPMEEYYFLYYEEVDWSFRRENHFMSLVPDAIVYHHVGGSIGSGTLRRRSSVFSNYFNFRNRARFMRRFFPRRLFFVYAFSFAKIFQMTMRGHFAEAHAALYGLAERPPPRSVSAKLSEDS